MKRPIGITLLGIVFLAAGISYLLLGLQMTTAVTFGPLDYGSGVWAYGWLIILTGVAFAAAGFAAWSLQAWAWMLGQILAILGLVEAVIVWLSTGDFGAGAAAGLFPLLVLWYLNRDVVKKAFGLTDA